MTTQIVLHISEFQLVYMDLHGPQGFSEDTLKSILLSVTFILRQCSVNLVMIFLDQNFEFFFLNVTLHITRLLHTLLYKCMGRVPGRIVERKGLLALPRIMCVVGVAI